MKLVLRLIALYVSTILHLSSFSAQASVNQCALLFSDNLSYLKADSYEPYYNYYKFNYENFKKILFLSDMDVGAKYARRSDRSQLFVTSDIDFKDKKNEKVEEENENKSGSLKTYLDNNFLPFIGNSFDLILMNRGLCVCKGGGASCGGVDIHYEPMKKLLLGVIDVLDKKQINSLALFTGFYYPGMAVVVPALWKSILNDLKTQFPSLQFTFIYSERKSGGKELIGEAAFIGFAISTGPQPIEATLNQLDPTLAPVSQ